MFDLIHLAMVRACGYMGRDDDVFNLSTFGRALSLFAWGYDKEEIDPALISVILCGRQDVEPTDGGGYKLKRE